MTEPAILYSKESFTFKRNDKNNYTLSFDMENKNIFLSKIIDFNLLKLIYDLNKDVYEKSNIKIINDNEAVFNLLMKHLFEDLGLPQRFSYINIKRIVKEKQIIFVSQTIKDERPPDMPPDAEIMNINCLIECNVLTPHFIQFEFNVLFEKTTIIPAVTEKLIGLILFKLFKRVKQFIENVKL